MKKSFTFIGLFFCLSFSAFSQAGFRPGFIITNEGDTIQGKVAYLDETILLRTCQFLEEGASMASNYSPGEIFGYGFTGDKFFVSREVTVFTPAHVRRSTSGDRQILESSLQEKVFLELIVQGAANLYKYNPLVFYAEKNGEFFQLYAEEREFVAPPGSRATIYVQDFKRYVGVLQMIMGDCPEATDRINKSSLYEESLRRLFMFYSLCVGEDPIYFKEKRKKFGFSIIPKAGVSGTLNSFNQPFRNNKIFLEDGFKFQARPIFGGMMSVTNIRTGEELALQLGLFLSPGFSYKDSLRYSEGVLTYQHTVEMGFSELQIPLGLRYTFLRKSFNPYFGLGVVFINHFSMFSTWKREEIRPTGNIDLPIPDDFLKPSQFGFWLSGGLEIPVSSKVKMLCELNLNATNGLIYNTPYVTNSNRKAAQILIGLRF